MESDLYPKSRDNKLMKYADDTNLLVLETSNVLCLKNLNIHVSRTGL